MRILRRLTRKFFSDAGIKHDVRRTTRKFFSDAGIKYDVRALHG
ncbi:hypothetical protein [Geodermatophilus sp. SYSU D01105]